MISHTHQTLETYMVSMRVVSNSVSLCFQRGGMFLSINDGLGPQCSIYCEDQSSISDSFQVRRYLHYAMADMSVCLMECCGVGRGISVSDRLWKRLVWDHWTGFPAVRTVRSLTHSGCAINDFSNYTVETTTRAKSLPLRGVHPSLAPGR